MGLIAILRSVSLIFTDIFWPLFFVLWWVKRCTKPYVEKVNKLFSQQQVKQEINSKPTFIVHTTDLHIITSRKNEIEHLSNLFKFISDKINPACVCVTGDITDGRIRNSKFSTYGQLSSNWEPYLNILNENPKLKVLTVAGNHDEVSTPSISSVNHQYLNNICHGDSTKYEVNTFDIDTSNGRVHIILYNPYFFPYSPCPYGTFLKPTQEQLMELENACDKSKDCLFNLLMMHHPTGALENSEQFLNVVGPLNNFRYSLVGHYHFKEGYKHIVGHGIVESIGPTPKNCQNFINIISIDNGISAISTVDITKPISVIMCPPPADQFVPRNYYIGNNFRVRVAVFDKQPHKIRVNIDGFECGELEKDFEADNYIVYGLNVNCLAGNHQLFLNGDVENSTNFIVGYSSEERKQLSPGYHLRVKKIVHLAYSSDVMMAIILILPFVLGNIPFISSFFKRIDDYLISGSNYTKSDILDFFVSLIVGPFYMMWRFSQASTFLKCLAILTHVLRWIVPFHFSRGPPFTTVWFWGITFGWKTYIDRTVWMAEAISIGAISWPFYNLVMLIGSGQKFNGTILFLLAFGVLLVAGGIWGIYVMANMADGLWAFFTSPSLYKTIITFIILCVYLTNIPAVRQMISN